MIVDQNPWRTPFGKLVIVCAIIAVAVGFSAAAAVAFLKSNRPALPSTATPLQLVTTHMDRTPLESGNQLLTITGRVINPSDTYQDVPPIHAALKNRNGDVVYEWTIQPPAHGLSGGASVGFDSTEVNVPQGADSVSITLENQTGA